MSQPTQGSPLSLPPIEQIAVELEDATPETLENDEVVIEDPELERMAAAFVDEIMSAEGEALQRQRHAVDEMGLELQQQAVHHSEMLQTPLRKLAHQGDEGGPVAQALSDLRERMQTLDPHQQRLAAGPFDRLLARLPGGSSRVQRYFRKFESAQEALNAIIADLESGRDMLRRDNITLSDDQERLRKLLGQLERQVDLGRLIDRRLVAGVSRLTAEDPQRAFIEEELLFPLRQRIVDLQQQQAVSQQGVLALEVIIRNNRELMRGVDRAIHVTVSALTVAIAVALALANQRLVLDRVESLNTTTAEMITGTAQALRQQGVEIQTRAASAQLDMQALEEAFNEVQGAIDDLSRYRQEALPQLDAQIDRLAQLAHRGGASIEKLQQGSAIQAEPAKGADEAPRGN